MPTLKEIAAWYDFWHLEYGKSSWRPRWSYYDFLPALDNPTKGLLLDIGCGTGQLLSIADEAGLMTYGVDVSSRGVTIAREISPNSLIEVYPGEELDFQDNFFDYVTCTGSLEHFFNINKTLAEIRRVIKPNGRICISVPNKDFVLWWFQEAGSIQIGIKESLYSLKGWKAILGNAGFEITKVGHDNYQARKRGWLFRFLWRFLPLKWTYVFVFSLRVTE